jgi:hypothetical protein
MTSRPRFAPEVISATRGANSADVDRPPPGPDADDGSAGFNHAGADRQSGLVLSIRVTLPEFVVSESRPHGLSFRIAELLLGQSWAEAHALRMTVRLDHGVDQEEYEEVLAFSKGGSTLCQWMIWRNDQAVFVQPLIGRPRRYDSVTEALEALTPKLAETLTDLEATHWPR